MHDREKSTTRQLIPAAQDYEHAAQAAAKLFEQLSEAEAIALIIEDNHYKAQAVKEHLPEMSVKAVSTSATAGVALLETVIDHELPEDAALPQIIVLMDGRFPADTSVWSEPQSGMGLIAAQEIISLCRERDIDPPVFVGISSDKQPNIDLNELLEANGLAGKYMGDYFVSYRNVYNNLGAVGLSGFSDED